MILAELNKHTTLFKSNGYDNARTFDGRYGRVERDVCGVPRIAINAGAHNETIYSKAKEAYCSKTIRQRVEMLRSDFGDSATELGARCISDPRGRALAEQ